MSEAAGVRGANIGSRIFRMGLGVVSSLTPMLAGYKTVGALKDAAVRNMGEEAASGGETGAPGYQEYESDALSNLRDVDWQQMIDASKEKIKIDPNPAVARQIATGMLPALLTQYQNKVRSEYGSRSSAADAMEASIAQSLAPKMDILKQHLEDAQAHRRHVQELEAIGGGIAGGAAIGAGLGLLGGPFAPLTVTAGAIVGAIIGGVIGAIGAAAIAWG